MATMEELDNLLVQQKDQLLQLINDGKLDTAKIVLGVLRPLWEASGYSYKVNEVTARLLRESQWHLENV